MLKLYQFAPALGLPNVSNFCLKLETYLLMADIPFESVYGMEMSKAPKGKMPYVEDIATAKAVRTLAAISIAASVAKSAYAD